MIDPAKLFAPEGLKELSKRLEDQERARIKSKEDKDGDKKGQSQGNR